ncbi:MAG: pseudouridine synthase [Candidatus Binatia bacterium]
MSELVQGGSFRVSGGRHRLDRLLADHLACGRRCARKLISEGAILVDGRRRPGSFVPGAGSMVTVALPEGSLVASGQPELATAQVILERTDLAVLQKPAGLHSHSGRRRPSVTAFTASRYPETLAAGTRPEEGGIVHRLDLDTSGVLVVARSRRRFLDLRRAFHDHRVVKHYLAIVAGELDRGFESDTPIVRRRTGVRPPRPGEQGLPAHTSIRPLETGRGWTLVTALIRTGAPHQIRAHLAWSGYPIIGDLVYGDLPAPAHTRSGQLLHAMRVVLPRGPDVSAAVPSDFVRALALLRHYGVPCLSTAENS